MTRSPHMGSWLSSALNDVGSFVAGDGNPAGNSATRSLGYDPAQVGPAVAVILSQPAAPAIQSELLLMGAAGLGLILLLHSSGRKR
jgi:hypothetical protein